MISENRNTCVAQYNAKYCAPLPEHLQLSTKAALRGFRVFAHWGYAPAAQTVQWVGVWSHMDLVQTQAQTSLLWDLGQDG